MRFLFIILFSIYSFVCSGQQYNFFWQLLRQQSGGPPPPVRTGLIFESKFEGVSYGGLTIPVDIGSPWDNQQHCCGYSVSAAPIAQFGTGAVQFDLRSGDPPVSGAPRSEITGPGEGATNFEHWYGAAFYPVTLGGNDLSVIQWHQNIAVSIPPMSLWISGGSWVMVHTADGVGVNNIYSLIGPVTFNQWTSFVFHIRWSNTASGLLEVFQNGALVLSFSGITGYINGNYMKVGVYQWDGVPFQQILYIDEVRIGDVTSNFISVNPGNY